MSKQLVAMVGLLVALSLFAQGGEGEEGEEGGWGPDIRLTYDPAESNPGYTGAWHIATSSQYVHAVWYDYRDGNSEIYYKRSSDGGLTWESDIRLTNASGDSKNPAITVSGSYVYIVWADGRPGGVGTYFKRSVDNGVTWSADTRISSIGGYPSMAASGSNVHIVCSDILYIRSTDYGATWGVETRINEQGFNPSVACVGNTVHVAWHTTDPVIQYKHSTDNGTTWGAPVTMPPPSGGYHASIAASADNVNIVWHNYADGGNLELFQGRSTDNGVTWGSSSTRVTYADSISAHCCLAASGNELYMVWYDKRDCNADEAEIYYKRSTDNGATWEPDIRLTNAPGWSGAASVAASESLIHVQWMDYRDGNWEVYYKHYFPPKDAGTISIDFPYDTVWRGFSYTPKATVKNFESVEANFNVVCEFDSAGTVVYSDTASVNGLLEDSTIQISFNDWIPAGTGQYAMSVITLLEGDCDPSNDLMSKNVTSVLPPRDVAVLSLDSPHDTVWSEHIYIPRATFENLFLEETASFQAVCEFDTSGVLVYADTVAVTDLEAGQTRQVSFAPWATGEENGILYNMNVKTVMPGDIDTTNDKLSKSVFALWPPRDVASVAIITPPDFVWSGFAHIPRVWVKNLWEEAETFDVACTIDSLGSTIYAYTVQVTSLGGGDSLLLEFDPWSAGAVDTFSYSITFITQLAKDLNRYNDTIVKEIHAVREVADIDIQDYAGNLSANTMFLTGARNAIIVGSYIMVNPDNWQKNVDLYDGPANTNLKLSYKCSDLVLYDGSQTIPRDSVNVNTNEIFSLDLGKAVMNIVQVRLFHRRPPGDDQRFVGKVTITASGEGMSVSDEFNLEVKQVSGGLHRASGMFLAGEPMPEGNRLYWSRFGFGEQSYRLYRAELDSDEYSRISEYTLAVTDFTDYDVKPETDYKYKLGLEMPDGKEITIGPLSLTSSKDVGSIVLYANSGPWFEHAEICFYIPQNVSSARLKVYDITGKLVKTLVDGPLDAGEHSVTWPGTDERGRKVSAGVYFYILESGNQKQTQKTVLIR